jgi:hypothetical protein
MDEAVGVSTRWRRTLARWLDPAPLPPPPPAQPLPQVPADGPARHRGEDAGGGWSAVSEQFAVRILTTTYQMGVRLEAVEADEQDPVRLEHLYSLDHAISRIRRQAENLLVLTGHQIEDAERQATSMVDVVRAATSTIEHYTRVHIGRIVELAVVEYAADDVIRVLTELLDNATRFSPPGSNVLVAAHLTETGSVLVRVEDAGFGIEPDRLAGINAMLASPVPLRDTTALASRLGLVVVHRLALAHGLRVQLADRPGGGGITALVAVPAGLIGEIASAGYAAAPGPSAPAQPSAAAPSAPAWSVTGPSAAAWSPATPPPAWSVETTNALSVQPEPVPRGGLPVRRPTSLRAESPRRQPVAASGPRSAWADDAADFAAGIEDARRPAGTANEGPPR